jgi:hypothetical protein
MLILFAGLVHFSNSGFGRDSSHGLFFAVLTKEEMIKDVSGRNKTEEHHTKKRSAGWRQCRRPYVLRATSKTLSTAAAMISAFTRSSLDTVTPRISMCIYLSLPGLYSS